MFIGFTGKAFDIDKTVQVNKGSVVQLGHYQLTIGGRDAFQKRGVLV